MRLELILSIIIIMVILIYIFIVIPWIIGNKTFFLDLFKKKNRQIKETKQDFQENQRLQGFQDYPNRGYYSGVYFSQKNPVQNRTFETNPNNVQRHAVGREQLKQVNRPICILDDKYSTLTDITAQWICKEKYGKDIYTVKGKIKEQFKRKVADIKNELLLLIKDNQSDFEKRLIERKLINDKREVIKNNNLTNSDIACVLLQIYHKRKIENNTGTTSVNFNDGISPSDFFELKKKQNGDMVGVYVLLNINKRMFYVGQAKRVFFRVNQHFTGHGNKDVYSDYQYGNTFRIKIIKLRESGYDDIDKLEKDMIAKYDAYNTGYNKTSGNG